MLSHVSEFPAFLRLNSIILYVYHILLFHSSFSGRLGCFHILAIMNNAVMNIFILFLWTWVCTYLLETLLSVLLSIYPEMELLNHVIILFFNFWWSTALFTHSGDIILHSHQQGTSAQVFPHCFNTCYFLFFDSSYLNEYDVVSHCHFHQSFPND